MRRMKGFGLLLSGGVVSLVLAGTALAQTPSGRTYGGAAGELEQQVGGGVEGTGSTLPFTGLDLGIAVAVGLTLLAVGILMRRMASR
jgi:hypothetical protein